MQKFTTDVIIGLEIHAELKTKTKLFCACPTQGSGEPNSRTCATCLGMPGSKPVLNRKAVEHALRVCLALDSGIAKEMVFSRKSYFYPDMSKNYQITQYELPIGTGGSLKLESGKTVSMKLACANLPMSWWTTTAPGSRSSRWSPSRRCILPRRRGTS